MCMAKIEQTIVNPTDDIEVGWKRIIDGGYYGDYYLGYYYGQGSFDTWVKANETPLMAGYDDGDDWVDGGKYVSGFHAFTENVLSPSFGNSLCCVRKVYLRKVTYRGLHVCEGKLVPAIVAMEQYIPSDPNGVPPELQPKAEATK